MGTCVYLAGYRVRLNLAQCKYYVLCGCQFLELLASFSRFILHVYLQLVRETGCQEKNPHFYLWYFRCRTSTATGAVFRALREYVTMAKLVSL